jgi:hypothetical protein
VRSCAAETLERSNSNASKVFIRGSFASCKQPSDGPALALLHLGRQQRLEITDMGLTLPGCGLGQPGELAADRRHAQRLAVLANGLVLEILHHALPTQGVEISSVS